MNTVTTKKFIVGAGLVILLLVVLVWGGLYLWSNPTANNSNTADLVPLAAGNQNQTPNVGSLYVPLEFTRSYNSLAMSNPWNDGSLVATFTSPGDRQYQVDGFYYGPNLWKLRFAPMEIGTWKWTLTWTPTGSAVSSETGSINVTPSTRPGYLRISRNNPYRLVFDNGKLFNGLGLGECMNDLDNNGDPYNDLAVDGGMRPEGQEKPPADALYPGLKGYFDLYGPPGAGFNIYRWSVDNCAYKLWDKISPAGNTYLTREGIWGDQLVEQLTSSGWRVYMSVFGFAPPYPETAGENPAEAEAVKKYLRYINARYGAYVDIWELMNEAVAKPAWYKFAATYLKSIDPYQHPVTTSWEKPELDEIEINAPHWYALESEFESDKITAEMINGRKGEWSKPIIFGEQGNSVQNWDPKSALRLRIRSWSAFFSEGMLIFWNTSAFKNYKTPVAANVYLGPIERGYVKILQDFSSRADANVQMVKPKVTPAASLRAYGLSSADVYMAYVVTATGRVEPVRGARLQINPRLGGEASWIDPATGQVLAKQTVVAGNQTLIIPKFMIDVALKIQTE